MGGMVLRDTDSRSKFVPAMIHREVSSIHQLRMTVNDEPIITISCCSVSEYFTYFRYRTGSLLSIQLNVIDYVDPKLGPERILHVFM